MCHVLAFFGQETLNEQVLHRMCSHGPSCYQQKNRRGNAKPPQLAHRIWWPTNWVFHHAEKSSVHQVQKLHLGDKLKNNCKQSKLDLEVHLRGRCQREWLRKVTQSVLKANFLKDFFVNGAFDFCDNFDKLLDLPIHIVSHVVHGEVFQRIQIARVQLLHNRLVLQSVALESCCGILGLLEVLMLIHDC